MNRLLLSLCCLSIPWTVRGGIADKWVLDSSPQNVPIDTVTAIVTAYESPIPKQSHNTAVRSILLSAQLPASTTGNPINAVRYWFDSDRPVEQELPNTNSVAQIDVSGLSAGIHSLYVQAEDTAGICSDITARIFYRIPSEAANTAVHNIYYWYDNDAKIRNKLAATGGTAQIDASALAAGLHTIYIQAEDAAGLCTDVTTRVFYKIPNQQQSAIKAVNYWFDEDLTINKQLPTSDGVALIDVSTLTAGLHTIYIQAEDATGLRTDVTPRVFYKIPAEVDRTLSWAYWFDEDEQVTNVSTCPGETVLLDASQLSEGIHYFQSCVLEGDVMSDVVSRIFYIVPSITNAGDQTCLCLIDNKLVNKSKVAPNGGIIHWDLDVTSLEPGIHKAAIVMVTANGLSSLVSERYFVRLDLKGIEQYDYWLNEDGPLHSIKLESEQNPFSLISLLPVETMPIRSSCFHFEVKNDQPTVYAKNNIHLRFHDTAGRHKEISKQFVDYKVSEPIELLTPLTSGQREWKNVPEENKIHWFTAQALRGDSLSVKTTQAATLQIFSPTGKEVYAASGAESIKIGGLHAEEDGTYYVALHDVKGTSSPTIGLDYEHIDKYAVLRQDVTVVGNGGVSTITFDGNGFQDLYAVDLFTAEGDTIHQLIIGHESKATTSVAFDFTGVPLGKYDALFRFTEENKTFPQLITVEEAKDIELETMVSYPWGFIRGGSVTYTINITNKGNMTAYNVPIYTYIKNMTDDGIINIKYDALNLPSFAETILLDSMSEKGNIYIQYISDILGDNWQFIRLKGVDDNTGDSIIVRSNYFFTNISPYTTKTLTLTISSKESVDVYVTIPNNWKEYSYKYPLNSRPKKLLSSVSASGGFDYCCYREGIECMADLIVSRLDAAAIAATIAKYIAAAVGHLEVSAIAKAINVADCVAGIGNAFLKHYGYSECGLSDSTTTKEELHSQALNVEKSLIGSVVSCIGLNIKGIFGDLLGVAGALGNNYGNYSDIMRSIAYDMIIPGIPIGSLIGTIKCATKFFDKTSNCGGDPRGGPSVAYVPVDPNDIIGYYSESGSTFIKEGLQDLHYTIEFENDPEIATGSAHEIVVTDTLDVTKFDLNSYVPTRLKIGLREVKLDGTPNFVTTVDMRPEINAIAQVEGNYDKTKGAIRYTFSSLDPMTMEKTDHVMQGILPVNDDQGSGIGEVSYNIRLKKAYSDGTAISNQATIVFDTNDAINTPVWTNVVDAVAPTSRVASGIVKNDSIVTLRIQSSDARSGVWKYDVYAQLNSDGAWEKVVENTADTLIDVRFYEGIDQGFYVCATDSAGNVEQKEAAREWTLNKVYLGDANGDGRVNSEDVLLAVGKYLGRNVYLNIDAADVNHDGNINSEDVVGIVRIYLEEQIRRNIPIKRPLKRRKR